MTKFEPTGLTLDVKRVSFIGVPSRGTPLNFFRAEIASFFCSKVTLADAKPDVSDFKTVYLNCPNSEKRSLISLTVTEESKFDTFNVAGRDGVEISGSDPIEMLPSFFGFSGVFVAGPIEHKEERYFKIMADMHCCKL